MPILLYTQKRDYTIVENGIVTWEQGLQFLDDFSWGFNSPSDWDGDYAPPLVGFRSASSRNTFLEVTRLRNE
jgi:hypothetical protein